MRQLVVAEPERVEALDAVARPRIGEHLGRGGAARRLGVAELARVGARSSSASDGVDPQRKYERRVADLVVVELEDAGTPATGVPISTR